MIVEAQKIANTLQEAQENHDTVNNMLKNTKANSETWEKSQFLYERRANIGIFFLQIMNEVLSLDSEGSDLFWDDDVPIGTVLAALGFHSWGDMQELTRDEVLACSHTLDLKRYESLREVYRSKSGMLTTRHSRSSIRVRALLLWPCSASVSLIT